MRADSLRTVLPTKSAMQPSALSAQPASSSMSRRRGLLSTSTPSPPNSIASKFIAYNAENLPTLIAFWAQK